MKRKNFITTLLLGASSGALLSSCANETSSSKGDKSIDSMSNNTETKAEQKDQGLETGLIIHSVYFWLKKDITADEEKDFLNFFEELKKVPSPNALKIGKPAPTTPRDVVDNSFSYFLLVTFKNMDDLNNYENHPIHLGAIEKFSKYWIKVEVKDATLL